MPTPPLLDRPATPPAASAAIEAADWTNRKASAQALRAAQARQVSGRRRFVDPTTCEREYNFAEMEFMQAMQDYKQRSGRMFPTWSEVLEVLRSLGYEKPGDSLGTADLGSADAQARPSISPLRRIRKR
jgi:hypothetical protein